MPIKLLVEIVAIGFLLFGGLIAVIVVGSNLVGRATGSADLDSKDFNTRRTAVLKVVAAGVLFVLLIQGFNWLVGLLDHTLKP